MRRGVACVLTRFPVIGFVCCAALCLVSGCRAEQGAPPAEAEHSEMDHGAGQTVVRLSPEALARASLQTEVVERVARGALVLAPAALEPDGARIATVGPRVAGRVASIAVSAGDRVRPGAVLATVESAEVASALAEAAATRTAEQVARQNYERERSLLEHGISAQRDVQVAEAELARATGARQVADGRLNALGLSVTAPGTNQLALASPIAGTVVERNAVVGAPVSPTDVLFRIADLTSLWLVANVPETQLRQVRRGQTVKVTLDALPDTTVDGRVSYVADAVRSDTRTVDVRVVVPNADGRLKPGMFARARIEIGAPDSPSVGGMTIPSVAVQRLAGATVVFVQTGAREFTARTIAAEASAGDHVLVVDGLNPGDVIVTRGSFILKAEAVRGQSGDPH